MSGGTGNVVSFRREVPGARLKRLEATDPRATCQHLNIEVWVGEPIITCAACQAVVDPYAWIRVLTRDWEDVTQRHERARKDAEREMADLRKQLRVLRGEYRDEAERVAAERAASRAVAVMPPRRGFGV